MQTNGQALCAVPLFQWGHASGIAYQKPLPPVQISRQVDGKTKGNKILFEEYPDIKMAYGLSHSLRLIFSKNTIKDAVRLSMARWYNRVDDSRMKQFNVIAATFYEHYDEILNFYNNRASNAAAESFNAKIKLFRANLHGVVDKKFFLFRIAMLYGYPH